MQLDEISHTFLLEYQIWHEVLLFYIQINVSFVLEEKHQPGLNDSLYMFHERILALHPGNKKFLLSDVPHSYGELGKCCCCIRTKTHVNDRKIYVCFCISVL
jgi:hypothetical protein